MKRYQRSISTLVITFLASVLVPASSLAQQGQSVLSRTAPYDFGCVGASVPAGFYIYQRVCTVPGHDISAWEPARQGYLHVAPTAGAVLTYSLLCPICPAIG